MAKFKKEAERAFDRFIEEFLNNPFRNINERIEKGRTVLHYAAQLSDAGMVRLLIEEGANINARDERGETALHVAAFSGKAENVKELIERGGEVNAKSNNKAVPLHLACLAGGIQVIEELINAGGDIKAIDKFGCSPLNYGKIYPKVTICLEKKGINMKDVEVKCEKANEVIEEVMNRRHEGKMMSLEEVKKLVLEEFSSLEKAEKVKTTNVIKELVELTEKTENALSSLNLKGKRIEEIREKLEGKPLVKKALLEVDRKLGDLEKQIKEL